MPRITVRSHDPRRWTATFDHPPINLMDPDTIYELDALLDRVADAPELRVIVFDSANPDYFIAHWDVSTPPEIVAGMRTASATRRGMHPYTDVLTRLGRASVVTIASVRGRARGAGSEFALACDVRFASRERAVFGQFEVGVGAVPGGGATARLPRLLGRGRALEALLGGDDFDAGLAERYGWINRAVPDAELEAFVDAFARRIAGYDRATIIAIKALVDAVTVPGDAEFVAAMRAFAASTTEPGRGRTRLAELLERGLQRDTAVERCLGAFIARDLSPAQPGRY